MKIGIGIGIGSLKGVASGQLTFYVRPTGSTYGTGDGSSYANAWDGFTAVGSLQQNAIVDLGGRLAICGTHNEIFNFLCDGLNVIGNDFNEAGVIDLKSVYSTCVEIDGIVNVSFSDIVIKNALVSLIELANGASLTNYRVTFINSGNQAVQHLNTSISYNYDCIADDISDEVFSTHDESTCYVYRGQFNDIRTSFVGATHNSRIYVYDVWNVTNCPIFADSANTDSLTESIIYLYNCRGTNIKTTQYATINIKDSYIILNPTNTVNENQSGKVRFTNCRVFCNPTGTAVQALDMQTNSTFMARYTEFINMSGNTYAVVLRSGVTLEGINNCIFYGTGSGTDGRAISAISAYTVRNCIFRNMGQVFFNANVTSINCSFTNVGTVSGTQTDSVNEDPLFANESELDFTLQAGSPMIGAGLTISGIGDGILTADWGSATESPTVTSGAPNVPPDIGAYIY